MEPLRPVTDEVRNANDRHRHWVPLLVLSVLLLITYAWTDWMSEAPPPGIESLSEHSIAGRAFASHGHLRSRVWIYPSSTTVDSHGQRQILFLMAALAFLSAYYLPLKLKKQPVVGLTLLGVGWVLGAPAVAALLGCHVMAFATFHPPATRRASTVVGAGVVAVAAWLNLTSDAGAFLLGASLSTPLVYLGYEYVYHPLLRSRFRPLLQGSMAHVCLLYVLAACLWNGLSDAAEFARPVGCLLFFWQWERLVLYQIDLKYGRVPRDLSFSAYLATFLSPATLANFPWLSRIPKGYAYLADSFLARDKNLVVLSGLKLIGVSVVFFTLAPIALELFRVGMEATGLVPDTSYSSLVRALRAGAEPSVPAVWCVLVYQLLRFYFLWSGIAHLKVGLWRLFGYDIEPYFQKPFLSRNLVEFWRRYSYYYKEFLVQAFYYPVFFRFFKQRPMLRIFAATFAAAGVGNLIYHLMYVALWDGATPDLLRAELKSFPYYVLIGTAIASTQCWLVSRGRRGRRPWAWGQRVGRDVMAVIGTFGVFIVIRPFHHVPIDHSIGDGLRIFLAAFGIT